MQKKVYSFQKNSLKKKKKRKNGKKGVFKRNDRPCTVFTAPVAGLNTQAPTSLLPHRLDSPEFSDKQEEIPNPRGRTGGVPVSRSCALHGQAFPKIREARALRVSIPGLVRFC